MIISTPVARQRPYIYFFLSAHGLTVSKTESRSMNPLLGRFDNNCFAAIVSITLEHQLSMLTGSCARPLFFFFNMLTIVSHHMVDPSFCRLTFMPCHLHAMCVWTWGGNIWIPNAEQEELVSFVRAFGGPSCNRPTGEAEMISLSPNGFSVQCAMFPDDPVSVSFSQECMCAADFQKQILALSEQAMSMARP